jgi:hypothetical protein
VLRPLRRIGARGRAEAQQPQPYMLGEPRLPKPLGEPAA